MRWRIAVPVAAMAVCVAVPSFAVPPRPDAIWARSTAGQTLTLDGVLNEPAWASAESKVIQYRVDAGPPGSGWKDEGGAVLPNGTNATLKFLTVGNQLWLGAFFPDSSVGGGGTFNQFDGLLMGLKDHSQTARPAPIAEYLYAWWSQVLVGTPPTNMAPVFGGRWATPPWGGPPRTQAQIDAWDARTVVHGTLNSDTLSDVGYTIEMRFDIGVMGYNVLDPDGDIIEWNVSIYDCDWRWPFTVGRFGANRTWWQAPWGNASAYNEVMIHARPNVTINSGPAPLVDDVDVLIPSAGTAATPVIDGLLTDAVWAGAPSFDIRFDDPALRESYPGVGPWRSGQFQPNLNGGTAAVLDPGDATIKYFHKGNLLYLGFDVRDQVVQFHPNFDSWDGFMVGINSLDRNNPDHVLSTHRLTFRVGPTGGAQAEDGLPAMVDTAGAFVGLALKPGTVIDTLGTSPDVGYTAELAIDMTKLGYPSGFGDRIAYLSIDMMDGDSFTPFANSYGTRTWWFREYDNTCCPARVYFGPATVDVEGGPAADALHGISPNPFRIATSIRYSLEAASDVSLDVYDLGGRRVAGETIGRQSAGAPSARFEAGALRPGLYLVRVRALDPQNGAVRATLSGKLMLVD